MRAKQIIVQGIFVAVILAAFNTVPAFAAEELENDNHYFDTDDYCLRAHDVRVGLSEIQMYSSELELQKAILTTSDVMALVRSRDLVYEEWPVCLDWVADFSACPWESTESGWPVVVRAPAILMPTDSTITFRVFVVDDLPVAKTYTVTFAGCDNKPMTVTADESGIAQISLSDIPEPMRDGYDFAGWYLDQDLTKAFLVPGNEGSAIQAVECDLVLYPRWEQAVVVGPEPDPDPEPGLEPDPPKPDTKPDYGSDLNQEPNLDTNQGNDYAGEPELNLPLPVALAPSDTNSEPELSVDNNASEVSVATKEVATKRHEATSSSNPNNRSVPTTTFNAEPVPQSDSGNDKGGVVVAAETILLGTLVTAATGLGVSITSDAKLLLWYANKKRAQLSGKKVA